MSKYTQASLLFLCLFNCAMAFHIHNVSNYTTSSTDFIFNGSTTTSRTTTVTNTNDEETIAKILITIFGFIGAALLVTYCCWEWNDRNICG